MAAGTLSIASVLPVGQKTDLRHRTVSLQVIAAGAAAGVTCNYKLRSEADTYGKLLATGDVWNVDGDIVEWIQLDPSATATVNITWDPGWVLRQPGNPSGPAVTSVAEEDSQQSLAAAGAEIVLVTGATSIPKGTLVRFNLGFQGPIATAADDLCYIDIRGHASGINYAAAPIGTAIAGTFRVNQAEKLDIVARNNDSVIHFVTSYLAAWTGE